MTPELSRPFAVARVGEATRVDVEADAAERGAVAARMGLHGLLALTCRFVLHRGPGPVVQAQGSLAASVVQTCVATLEPFATEVAEEFSVRFVPEDQLSEDLDIEAEDEIPYAGATIDLGEATAEQLALALDPFPAVRVSNFWRMKRPPMTARSPPWREGRAPRRVDEVHHPAGAAVCPDSTLGLQAGPGSAR